MAMTPGSQRSFDLTTQIRRVARRQQPESWSIAIWIRLYYLQPSMACSDDKVGEPGIHVLVSHLTSSPADQATSVLQILRCHCTYSGLVAELPPPTRTTSVYNEAAGSPSSRKTSAEMKRSMRPG